MFLSNLPKHFVINYLIYAKELELHLTYVELWLSFMPLFIENSDYIVKRRCSVILYTIATYLPKNLAKMRCLFKDEERPPSNSLVYFLFKKQFSPPQVFLKITTRSPI